MKGSIKNKVYWSYITSIWQKTGLGRGSGTLAEDPQLIGGGLGPPPEPPVPGPRVAARRPDLLVGAVAEQEDPVGLPRRPGPQAGARSRGWGRGQHGYGVWPGGGGSVPPPTSEL